ncbi:MAG: ribosome small subunit-dependent GTPase A [Rikenellaceae bacterium]|nr:ribosome small subunit-dependent GTPase A [Rikenellaceae bacterium]
MRGVVTKSTGSWYEVECDDGLSLRCRLRGRLRLEGVRTTNPLAVGDMVTLEPEGDDGNRGVITSLEPRRNYIIRRSTNLSKEAHIIAANIDTLFLVATLDFPPVSLEFIDRFLVTARVYRVPVVIVLNKMDLFEGEEFRPFVDNFRSIYERAGYKVVECSAHEGRGTDTVKEMMIGRVSLFSGNSGVGKSTLINAVAPHVEARVGDISAAHFKGRHTTTFSEMFKLPEGGYIIDTPGIKGFGLIDIEPEEVARYMPDLFELSEGCRFYNCTHTHEPGCAVKAAVESGELSAERYNSYLKMVERDEKYRL